MIVWEWFAPFDLPTKVVITPPPLMFDTVKPTGTVQVNEAMDGSVGTLKRPNTTRIHTWNFILTRMKALEFKSFFETFAGTKIKIVNHRSETIVGYFEVNPTTFDTIGRGVIANSKEKVSLSITFKST